MRDQLVRYLLGELNAQEREQLEASLRDSPELRREFAHLKKCLPGPDDCAVDSGDSDSIDDEDFERLSAVGPCSGLAERTLDKICGDGPCHERPHTAAEIADAYDAPTGTPSWSLADITVAGGVFLAISMLFVPALRQSRDAARRNGCVDNLRQMAVMFDGFSEVHGGYYPTPASYENMGMFAVLLAEDGYAGRGELARLLVCRASPVAEDIAAKRITVQVPTLCELQAATAKARCFLKKHMSPSYAYRAGYVEDGQYFAIRNEHSCHKAVLADNPRVQLSSCKKLQSDHHGGQNILFQDGHVGFFRDCALPEIEHDEIYVNKAGIEAAGLGRDDVVLGRSEMVPILGLPFAP